MAKKVLSFVDTLKFSVKNTFKFFGQFALLNIIGSLVLALPVGFMGIAFLPYIKMWYTTGVFQPVFSAPLVFACIVGIILFLLGGVVYNSALNRFGLDVYDKKTDMRSLWPTVLNVLKPYICVSLYLIVILFVAIVPGALLTDLGYGIFVKSVVGSLMYYGSLAIMGLGFFVICISMFYVLVRLMFAPYIVLDTGEISARKALAKSYELTKGNVLRITLYIAFVGTVSNILTKLSLVRLFIMLPPQINFSFLSLFIGIPFSVLLFVYLYKTLSK